MRLHWVCLTACVALMTAVTAARADLLDFSGLGLNAGDAIPQSYGDTDWVDVGHRRLDGDNGSGGVTFGDVTQVAGSLQWWGDGYGTLDEVAWGGDGTLGDNDWKEIGEFSFAAKLPGYTVTLHSFDLAGFASTTEEQYAEIDVKVFDGQWNLLWSTDELLRIPRGVYGEEGFVTVMPEVSASVLHLQWGFPEWVAIDNISFSVVPEPSTLVAWLLGAGCLGFWGYRRRRGQGA